MICHESDPDETGYPLWQTGLPALAGHPTYHVTLQYAESIQTLDRRLRNFGIYYEDDAISVENVKEVVKKEFEGPERSSLPADVLWGSFVTHSFLPHWGETNA